jgi:hypothetical protein
MKNIGSNYLFVKPHIDAIFLLTAFELLNIITIWLIFSFDSITGSWDADVVIAVILLFVLNTIGKLHNHRYKKVIEKWENKNAKSFFSTIVILYVIISIVSFYIIHSNI